jgi:AcrR family transcriptional regulator
MTSSRSSSSRPRRPRRRTRLTSDQVRQRLYEDAVTRFREQGYEATPISALTRDAGVAKGTFFNHFPSKEHILASWFVGLWNKTYEGVSGAGTDAIVQQYVTVTDSLLQDPVLAMALMTRMAGLPAVDSQEKGEPSAAPLDAMRKWTAERLSESLPLVVPIHPIGDDDLAAVMVATLVETLRDVLLHPSSATRGPTSRAKKNEKRNPASSLEARIHFLLASAGLVVT